MSYNISILSSPQSPEFPDHFQKALQSLQPSSADDFFSIIFSNFSKKSLLKSPNNIGKMILNSISKLCTKKVFIEILIRNEQFLKLPFDNSNFTDSFLDIFYYIITVLPTAINTEIIPKFQQLIPKSPQKCLTLLALYSQKFEYVYSPWALLDSLFSFSTSFSSVQIAPNYAAVLATLIRSYPDFRISRGKISWKQLTSLLSLPDPSVISYIYGALASAWEAFETQPIYPSSSLSVHLIRSETRYAALNFILRVPPPQSCPNLNSLIHSLIELALSEIRATLPLLWLTQTEKGSQFFLQDLKWMSVLPIISATRITSTLLIQPDNYQIILDSPHFITLLNRLSSVNDNLDDDQIKEKNINSKSSKNHFSNNNKKNNNNNPKNDDLLLERKENSNIKCGKQIACYFLRNTPISSQILKNLSSSGTLSNLLSLNVESKDSDEELNQSQIDETNSILNRSKRKEFLARIEFLIAERIAQIGFVQELVPITDRCILEMKENGALADVAAAVSLTLAQYTFCAQKLLDANLQDLLPNIPKNSNFYDLLQALVHGLQKL